MARNVFFRDFTLCKAGLLAALIGLAAFSGKPPLAGSYHLGSDAMPIQERVMPAAAPAVKTDCDDWVGVQL